jgi:hypothetical protein
METFTVPTMGYRNQFACLLLLSVCLAFFGCAHETKNEPQAQSRAEPAAQASAQTPATTEAAEVVAPLEPLANSEQKVPDLLVTKIANAFVPHAFPAERKGDYARGFAEGYRDAVTAPNATITRSGIKDDPALVGYKDGSDAGKHDAPIPLDNFIALYEANGYRRQTLSGVYTPAFEQMDFLPDGQKTRWWFTRSPYVTAIEPGHITVTVLVSPIGAHGQFGSYEREVVVVGMPKP